MISTNIRLKNWTSFNESSEIYSTMDLPFLYSDIDIDYPTQFDNIPTMEELSYLNSEDSQENDFGFKNFIIDDQPIVFRDEFRHSKSKKHNRTKEFSGKVVLSDNQFSKEYSLAGDNHEKKMRKRSTTRQLFSNNHTSRNRVKRKKVKKKSIKLHYIAQRDDASNNQLIIDLQERGR